MSSKDSKTVQEKINHLESLVGWFQGDQFVIEEALERYQAVEKLAEEIEADLVGLKNKIEVINQKFDTDS